MCESKPPCIVSGSSVLVLCIGLLFRIVAAFFATFRGGFNWKEKVFIAFAWLPKATVQVMLWLFYSRHI